MQSGSVTVVSPSGVERYRLDGEGTVVTVLDAVARFLGSTSDNFNVDEYDGVVQLGSSTPASLSSQADTILRANDVLVLLEGPIAEGGFKGA